MLEHARSSELYKRSSMLDQNFTNARSLLEQKSVIRAPSSEHLYVICIDFVNMIFFFYFK